MAAAVGRFMSAQGTSFLINGEKKNSADRRNVAVMASVAFSGMREEYETLILSPRATQKDVKSSFLCLALQMFAKEITVEFNFRRSIRVISIIRMFAKEITVEFNFRRLIGLISLAQAKQQNGSEDYYMDGMMEINNDPCDEWEEWMGWEGAGTLDYSSHINIYA
eukprot:PITA_04082